MHKLLNHLTYDRKNLISRSRTIETYKQFSGSQIKENIVQPMTLKVFSVLFFLIRHFIELVKQAVPTPTFMNVVEKRKNSSDPGSELNTVD